MLCSRHLACARHFGVQRWIKTHTGFLAFSGIGSNADLIPIAGEYCRSGNTHSWNSKSVCIYTSVDL